MIFSLRVFSFMDHVSKIPLPNLRPCRFTSWFSSDKILIVLAFTFRPLIHLYGVRYRSKFIFLHIHPQLFQYHLLKGISFPHGIPFKPCVCISSSVILTVSKVMWLLSTELFLDLRNIFFSSITFSFGPLWSSNSDC